MQTKSKNVDKLHHELVHIQKPFQIHLHSRLHNVQMNFLKNILLVQKLLEITSSCINMHLYQTSTNSRCSHIILHHFQSSAQPKHQKHHVASAIPVTCRNVALVHRRHGVYTSIPPFATIPMHPAISKEASKNSTLQICIHCHPQTIVRICTRSQLFTQLQMYSKYLCTLINPVFHTVVCVHVHFDVERIPA